MSAINTLTPRVSGVYFLKSGQQRDVFGLQDLHPNSNINKLEIYLEDGDGKNTVFINFRNDKKSAITSHWFPTTFMGYVNHTLIGEEIPRTFAKYVLFVSTMVTKWNLNGHAPLPISSTVVQVGGDRLIGLFGTLNDLNNEYNQSQKEELYLNNKVAYVYEENNNYGFYKLILDQSNYVWTKIDNPLDAYNIVDTKQYNVLGLTIQKGNAPTVKSQITISDEYIRFILSTLAEIKDTLIMVESDLGDKDGGAVGNTVWGEINYLLFWVNKIMTDSSIISYDNQDSGLTATNIQDAIDELENIMFKKDGSVKATGDFELNNKGIYDVSQISVGEINAQTQGGFIDVNDEMRFYDKTIGREGASDYEFVVKKQLDTELSKKLDKSGGTMTGDLDMNGNDISYVKELQVEKVTTGGGYSIEIEDDIDMRDNIIENVDIVKFAYGLQIQRSADKKEIRFYVPRTGGYGLIFKIVDGELRLHDGVKITNLADGTHIKDAVTKGQLDLKADQSTTYTKNEVNNLISQIPKFKIIKVSVLPTENIDLMAIYVLGNAEYIYIENETRWEELGTLEVDLINYFNKTEINSLLNDKVDKVTGKALSTNDYTNTDKQSVEKIPTIEQDILDLESDKVDKVAGMGLSTNDYTTTEKNKLSGIASGAEVNVQSDWNATLGDALILNKPIIPTNVSQLNNDSGYITGYTETDPIFTAWNKSTGISITKSQVSDLIEATQSLSGLMSATDKARLDVLHSLLEEDTENNVVDSINEVLAIFNNYPEGADLVTALAGKVDKVSGKGLSTNDFTNNDKNKLDGIEAGAEVNPYSKTQLDNMLDDKVDKNANITGATKTKITYDSKGLVTAGADLVEADIPALSTSKITQTASARFVTDTEKTTWNNKVDKVAGMGLSTNDYTTTEKNKLSGIASGAEVNVQSDWNATLGDALILNKPIIPTNVSQLNNDSGYITGYTETDPIFTAWNKSTGISITKSQVSDLIEATQSLSGLMSATDKARLDVLHSLLEEDTENNVVDSINEVLAIFNNYPEGADLVTALAGKVDKVSGKGLSTNDFTNNDKNKLDGIEAGAEVNPYSKTQLDNMLDDKVDKNANITGATKTKITYDSKGLVTAGADLVEADIPALSTSKITQTASARFVTDTEKTTWNNKVDKVAGMGLSTNDYTTTEKNKLSGIASGAEVNVQSDWNATLGDALILNKPIIPTNVSQLNNDSGYITGYTETDPIFTAWNKSTGISITKSQVSDLIEATQSLSGLMSATDKARLDVLHSLLEEDTENNVVDSINEVLAIFNNYPEGADLVTALAGKVDKVSGKGLSTNDFTNNDKNKLDGIEAGAEVNPYSKTQLDNMLDDKVDKNANITGATKTKITYDSKGLVTAGADLVEADIPALSTSKITQTASARFVTDTEKTTWNNKVDKVAGMGLSTNDYTTTEKNKLSGIASGAEVNVQSDWNATLGDALILNKPIIPTNVSQLNNDSGYITGYTETDPIFTAWNKSTGISITKSQVSDLIEATQSLSGLMSATDKARLDVLHSLLEEDTENNVVDSINEVLAIFNNYPEGADLVTALAGKVDKVSGKGLSTNDFTNNDKNKLDGIEAGAEVNPYSKTQLDNMLDDKVDKNANITGATKTKITYDSKGLVTAGADLVEADIPALSTSKITQTASARFVTDTEKTTWNNKVDKVAGMGLSTNDYTTTEKNKLSGIASGAEVNVQSDWNATSGDALILNKPIIPTNVSQLNNDSGYITGYTETDPIFTAWNKSTGISITKSQVSDLISATQSLSGLMSATDKQRLDVLHSLLEEDTANNVVDSINEVLAIFNNYPEGADLVTALAGKVDKVSGKGLSTNDLTNTLKSNYDTAYGWGNHAVEGYLKSITKAMVEAVLIGTITSHDHDGTYEPAFTKNTAFNKNFGTSAGTVAQGNHLHTGVYEPANVNIQAHISSTSNPHGVTKAQVGLGNVDNTSDLSKPISTAQQTAFANKVDKVTGMGLSKNDFTDEYKNKVDNQLIIGVSATQAYRGDLGQTAYNHSQSTHAPSNAQKNSDITKAEIEAKLIGTITSHSHALPTHTHTKSQITDFPTSMPPTAHNHDDRYYTENEVDTKLVGKADATHTHTKSQITDFPTSMPPTTHTHTKSQITDFPTSMPPTAHSTDLLTSGTLGIARGGTGRTDGYAVGAVGIVEKRATVLTEFWIGTQAQYNSIGTKDANTLYFII